MGGRDQYPKEQPELRGPSTKPDTADSGRKRNHFKPEELVAIPA